jgi:hypothetical protein
LRIGQFQGPSGVYQNNLWTVHPLDNSLVPGVTPPPTAPGTTPTTPTFPVPGGSPVPTTPTRPTTPTWVTTLGSLAEKFAPMLGDLFLKQFR